MIHFEVIGSFAWRHFYRNARLFLATLRILSVPMIHLTRLACRQVQTRDGAHLSTCLIFFSPEIMGSSAWRHFYRNSRLFLATIRILSVPMIHLTRLACRQVQTRDGAHLSTCLIFFSPEIMGSSAWARICRHAGHFNGG
jgi:hypothetical protein